MLLAIQLQEEVGLDVLTDGEQRRRHYIDEFARALGGFDFTQLVEKPTRGGRYTAAVATVASPGRTHDADPARRPAFPEGAHPPPVKVTMPGPMTIADTAHDAYYGDERTFAFALAAAINAEARALDAAGADVIQIDEPCFNVYGDKVAAWGVEALDRCLDGVAATTAVHICYGYGTAAVLGLEAAEHRLGPVSPPAAAAARLARATGLPGVRRLGRRSRGPGGGRRQVRALRLHRRQSQPRRSRPR